MADHEEIAGWVAGLARDPGNQDALHRLARAVARGASLARGEGGPAALGAVLDALRGRPEDGDLAGVALALMGLAARPAPPPPWWRREGRVLPWAEGEAPRDAASGMPLTVRRTWDDAEMVLVPAGLGWRGGAGQGPRHQLELDAFYIDRTPVPLGPLVASGLVPAGRYPPRTLTDAAEMHAAGTRVRFDEAEAYARHVGGRLPTEAEAARAMGGPEGWAFPWGDDPYTPADPDQGKAVSPFGLVAVHRDLWWWCADRYAADAYARSAGRNPRHLEPGPRPGASELAEADRIEEQLPGLRRELAMAEYGMGGNYSDEVESRFMEETRQLRARIAALVERQRAVLEVESGEPCRVQRTGAGSLHAPGPHETCRRRRPGREGREADDVGVVVVLALGPDPGAFADPDGQAEVEARAAARARRQEDDGWPGEQRGRAGGRGGGSRSDRWPGEGASQPGARPGSGDEGEPRAAPGGAGAGEAGAGGGPVDPPRGEDAEAGSGAGAERRPDDAAAGPGPSARRRGRRGPRDVAALAGELGRAVEQVRDEVLDALGGPEEGARRLRDAAETGARVLRGLDRVLRPGRRRRDEDEHG